MKDIELELLAKKIGLVGGQLLDYLFEFVAPIGGLSQVAGVLAKGAEAEGLHPRAQAALELVGRVDAVKHATACLDDRPKLGNLVLAYPQLTLLALPT